jgi:hypothetical protein
MSTKLHAELKGVEFKGKWPKAVLTLSADGEELGYRLYYVGKRLVLYYASRDRGKAERAAAMLRAFGVEAWARRIKRGVWQIAVTTNGLAMGDEALRGAVLKFVEELKAKGAISKAYYERLKAKLEAGVAPSALSVLYYERGNALVIKAQPSSKEAYEAIMRRLLGAGLIEDLAADEVRSAYVIAVPPKGKRRGRIALRVPEGLAQLIKKAFAGNPIAKELLEEVRRGVEAEARRKGEAVLRRYEEIERLALSEGASTPGATPRAEVLGLEARVDEEGRLRVRQRFKVGDVEVGCEIALRRGDALQSALEALTWLKEVTETIRRKLSGSS